jgi:hypothetical protein
MAMLVPEAYAANPDIDPDLKAFGDFHLCMNEPWDGPSAVVFSDGEVAAATLDRNGLRPARYLVTRDGRLLLASEVGVLAIDDDQIVERLRAYGIDIARRTVAKYRESLRIPSSVERRRIFAVGG